MMAETETKPLDSRGQDSSSQYEAFMKQLEDSAIYPLSLAYPTAFKHVLEQHQKQLGQEQPFQEKSRSVWTWDLNDTGSHGMFFTSTAKPHHTSCTNISSIHSVEEARDAGRH